MTWIDYLLIFVVFTSILLGVLRGLVREIFSLAGWALAFLVAQLFTVYVASWLPASWNETARLAAAASSLFLATLLAVSVVSALTGQLLKASGLSTVNRVLGGLFGMVRAGLIIFGLGFVAHATQLPQETAWKQSVFVPHLTTLKGAIGSKLPELLSYFKNEAPPQISDPNKLPK